VVDARDGEHTDDIESKAHCHCDPANSYPERCDAGDVDSPEHSLLKEVDPVKVVLNNNVAVVHGRLLAKYLSQPYGAMFMIAEQGGVGLN